MRPAFSLQKLILPLLIIVSVPLTVYLVYQNTDSRQHASQEVIAYLVPDTQVARTGEIITYTLSVDSHDTPVKEAQVNLAYPAFKGEIVSVETKKSSFDVPLEEIKGSGFLRLGRETTTPVYGLQQIATIQLKATTDIDSSEMTLAPGTQVHTIENTTLSPHDVIRQFPENSQEKDTSFIAKVVQAIRNLLP